MPQSESNDVEPAFGRVDELDDPRPGHLSDGPTPISSTTTITTTLLERFVKGEDQEQSEGQEQTGAAVEEGKEQTEIKADDADARGVGERIDEDKTEVGGHKVGKEGKATDTEGGEDKENQA